MLAPIRPRPIIPSCMRGLLPEPLAAWPTRRGAREAASGVGSLGAGLVEDVHPFAVAACDLGDGGLARHLVGAPVHERVPERRAAHGEAGEPGDAGRRLQPLAHFAVVLAAAQ